MNPKYKVVMRDSFLNRVMEVTDYSSLEMVLRFNKSGTWTMTVPAEIAREITAKTASKTQVGIIVERQNVVSPPMMSGMIEGVLRVNNKSENTYTYSGVTDSSWLWRRLVLPVAASPYDTQTGLAETLMRLYVSNHAGPGAAVARRIPGLTLSDNLFRGVSNTYRPRYDVLGDLLAKIALTDGQGLGFQIIQVGLGLVFQIYSPIDKTSTAKFSMGLGNLSEYKYSSEAGDVNYVYAAGAGVGSSRLIVEREDSVAEAAWGRMESFLDNQDANSTDLMTAGDELLKTNADVYSLSITPIDSETLRFGYDYNLGDKVTVVLDDDAVIQDVLREVKITVNKDGEEIIPLVGTPESLAPQTIKMFRAISDNRARISQLEKR